jgi:hypothetical protein
MTLTRAGQSGAMQCHFAVQGRREVKGDGHAFPTSTCSGDHGDVSAAFGRRCVRRNSI